MKVLKKVILFFIILFYPLYSFIGARYLIITSDEFFNTLLPLSEWKTKKGVLSKIVTLSEIGGNEPNLIKNYILNAYNKWEIKPEYVLIVGYPNQLTSYWNNAYRIYTDNWFFDFNNDNKPEIIYGRFPCRNNRECSLMVRKTLIYEKFLSPDTFWIIKGMGIINENNDSDDTIYWNDIRYFASSFGNRLLYFDTLSKLHDNDWRDIIEGINDGRGIVVYRGNAVGNWYSPFNVNPYLTENYFNLPIILSFTCQTLSLNPSLIETAAVGAKWLWAGNYYYPTGAVAFLGSTYSFLFLARARSCGLRAFIKNLFIENDNILGSCFLKAKDSMLYWDIPSSISLNLFGDPELNIWTEKPKPLNVIHPNQILPQQQFFTVEVYNENNEPLRNALVCLKKGDTIPLELYHYGYTDSTGRIRFLINPQTTGVMEITVTAKNCLPYEDFCSIVREEPLLILDSLSLFDFPPLGNGNLQINPNETILFKIRIKNTGRVIAESVFGKLLTQNNFVSLLDSVAFYGNILPEERKENLNPFKVYFNSNVPDGFISFHLILEDKNSNIWRIPFFAEVHKGNLLFLNYQIKDTLPFGNNNQILEPGEGVLFYLTFKNEGNDQFQNVYCRLKTDNQYLKISDSLGSFGEILPQQIKSNLSDPVAFYLSPLVIPGNNILLKVYLLAKNPTYIIEDSFDLVLSIGGANYNLPSGPDNYGYYLYDNNDFRYGNAPQFNWLEISAIGEEIPLVSESDDTTITIPLPFRFKFYSNYYDSITISSNGFVCLGSIGNFSGRDNLYLPNNLNFNIIAPFWDNLDTRNLSRIQPAIYQYYNNENHLFIIEYYDLYHWDAHSQRETFEIVFYDPNYYPTITGDGEIVFQYQQVTNASSNTVGIQKGENNYGLTYLFNNEYHPNASLLGSNRAIKITTNPPTIAISPFISLENLIISDNLGNNNGVIESGEPILLSITLKNLGNQTANNLLVILQKRDNDCVIGESIFDISNLLPNEEINNSGNPYLFIVNNNPNDTILDFTLKIAGNNYLSGIYFSLGIAQFSSVKEEKILTTIIRKREFKNLSKLEKNIKIFDFSGRKIEKKNIKKGIYFIKTGKRIRKIILFDF
ncbi:MAG: C25 family cysteine peptidase [candidate division WOR-3 bacterium]